LPTTLMLSGVAALTGPLSARPLNIRAVIATNRDARKI